MRARKGARNWRYHRVGELNERSTGLSKANASDSSRSRNFGGLLNSGNPDTIAAAGSRDGWPQAADPVSVALNNGRVGIARAQQPAECRIELDQHHPGRVDPAIDQSRRDGTGSRTEFDDGPRRRGGHSRICRATGAPRRNHGARRQGRSIQERMKLTSSSRRSLRLARLNVASSDIWGSNFGAAPNSVTPLSRLQSSSAGSRPRDHETSNIVDIAHAEPAPVPKKSFTRLKKPATPGLFHWTTVLEFGQQLALALGEVLRRLDHDLDVHVAASAASAAPACPCPADGIAGRTGCLPEFSPGSCRRRWSAPRIRRRGRRDHRDRHAAVQIGAVALEKRMGRHRQENIEIARRPAAHAGLAFAGEADAGAVLDARRNIDRQGALPRHAARPPQARQGSRSPGRGPGRSGRCARG